MVKINFWINQSPRIPLTLNIKITCKNGKWKMWKKNATILAATSSMAWNLTNLMITIEIFAYGALQNSVWDVTTRKLNITFCSKFANINQIAGDLHGMCHGIDFFPSKDQDNKNTKYKLALDDF